MSVIRRFLNSNLSITVLVICIIYWLIGIIVTILELVPNKMYVEEISHAIENRSEDLSN